MYGPAHNVLYYDSFAFTPNYNTTPVGTEEGRHQNLCREYQFHHSASIRTYTCAHSPQTSDSHKLHELNDSLNSHHKKRRGRKARLQHLGLEFQVHHSPRPRPISIHSGSSHRNHHATQTPPVWAAVPNLGSLASNGEILSFENKNSPVHALSMLRALSSVASNSSCRIRYESRTRVLWAAVPNLENLGFDSGILHFENGNMSSACFEHSPMTTSSSYLINKHASQTPRVWAGVPNLEGVGSNGQISDLESGNTSGVCFEHSAT